jgi:hypothetical protein
MRNRDIAVEYLARFCAGDIAGLEPRLAAALDFSGTLHDYHSASEYSGSRNAASMMYYGSLTAGVSPSDRFESDRAKRCALDSAPQAIR